MAPGVNYISVNKLQNTLIYPVIKLWGLLDELLSSIIKLLIDGRNQCESQFCVVLVVKRAQKKKTIRWNTLLYNSNMDTKSNHFLDINSKNYVLFFV